MPALPHAGNALVVARLYTDDPLNTRDSPSSREIFYVAEEDIRVERDKKCTVSVNVQGLKELTCALNVDRFMRFKSQCQWIKVMVYVDDTLLPELCDDYKYFKDDMQRSAFELLSPPFTVKEEAGQIQLVVKTGGPGKKWPDYVFQFQYFRVSEMYPATLIPAPLVRAAVSRHFRDVEKKSEVLVDKMKELQYNAEDRLLKERLMQEAAEAEARRLESVEQEQLEEAQNHDLRIERLIFKERGAKDSYDCTREDARGSTGRRSSFDERFEELCRGANQAHSPSSSRKVSFLDNVDLCEEECSHRPVGGDTPSHRLRPSPKDPRKKRLRFDTSGEVTLQSSSNLTTNAASRRARVDSCPPAMIETQISMTSKYTLPVPLMRNMKIASILNPRR